MNRLRSAVEWTAGRRRRRSVPIDRVRCNVKPVAETQGFGGQPIERFPGYQAFRLYLEDPDAGRELFRDWYRTQVFEREVWRYSKESGGLATGTLARAVARLRRQQGHLEPGFESAPREIVEAAIEERIGAYFALLESIRKDGLQAGPGQPITCWRRGFCYILIDGHHRTAAVRALGGTSVPVEIVELFRLRRWVRRVRRSLRRGLGRVPGER